MPYGDDEERWCDGPEGVPVGAGEVGLAVSSGGGEDGCYGWSGECMADGAGSGAWACGGVYWAGAEGDDVIEAGLELWDITAGTMIWRGEVNAGFPLPRPFYRLVPCRDVCSKLARWFGSNYPSERHRFVYRHMTPTELSDWNAQIAKIEEIQANYRARRKEREG